VASITCATVAPSARRSMVSTACCLVPSRGLRIASVAGRGVRVASRLRRIAIGGARMATTSVAPLARSSHVASTAAAACRRVVREEAASAGTTGAASGASVTLAAAWPSVASVTACGATGAPGAASSPAPPSWPASASVCQIASKAGSGANLVQFLAVDHAAPIRRAWRRSSFARPYI